MRRVLVVDDDFMVAEIHRKFVDHVTGFVTVGAARTGAAALEMAGALRPDLILLDVYLPDMTGLQAFAARADALASADGVDQSLIDSLFGGGPTTTVASEVLPKGLGAETGRMVLGALRNAGEVSAAECAELVGISRVSTRRPERRYLLRGV
jgi:response regulator of citrate/malate metabolism